MGFPWSAGDQLKATDLNAIVNFGGDGTDGALSGDTTIDASGASVVVKNYTLLRWLAVRRLICLTRRQEGTILILRCRGKCYYCRERN